MFYEMFNYQDHTEAVNFVKLDQDVIKGDIIQFGLPKKIVYRVEERKFIVDKKGTLIKCVLYVNRLYKE